MQFETEKHSTDNQHPCTTRSPAKSPAACNSEAPRCVYHPVHLAEFFDPSRNELACAMCYALGSAHGHPCLTLPEALQHTIPKLEAQTDVMDERLAQLHALRHSIQEMISISVLREKDVCSQIKQNVGMLMDALQKREASLVAVVEKESQSFRHHLEQKLHDVEKRTESLLSCSNTVTEFLESEQTSSIEGREARAAARLVQALVHSEREIEATRYYAFPETPLLSVHVAVAPSSNKNANSGSTSTPTRKYYSPGSPSKQSQQQLLPSDTETMARTFISLHKESRPTIVAPLALTGPAAAASAIASAALGSELASDLPIPYTQQSSTVDSKCARGAIFLIGCTSNHQRAARKVGIKEFAGTGRALYINPLRVEDTDCEAGRMLRVFSNVPLVDGKEEFVAQEALFVVDDEDFDTKGKNNFNGLRTANVEGAAIWWDFGSGNGIDVTSYTIVHGHKDEHCALRGWRLLGTNVRPPIATAQELRDDPSSTVAKLLEVPSVIEAGNKAIHVIDSETFALTFGAEPFESRFVQCRGEREEKAPFYRFIGLQAWGRPDAAGMHHVEIAGAEFYGTLRFGGCS